MSRVLGFPSDTNQAVQPQKMARIKKKRDSISIGVVGTKALTSCVVTVQMICTFVFASMQIAGFSLRGSSDHHNACINANNKPQILARLFLFSLLVLDHQHWKISVHVVYFNSGKNSWNKC